MPDQHQIIFPEGASALTQRERQILRLLASGMTDDQIARAIGRAPSTVQIHVSNIMRKLGVINRVQLGAAIEKLGVAD